MSSFRQSWGYRRNMKLADIYSMEELVRELTITVSCGGNLLMNVGPNKDGVIVPVFEAREMTDIILTEPPNIRRDSDSWVSGWRSMVRPYTAPAPGPSRTTPPTARCGTPARSALTRGRWCTE